jgi:hypothetical protein
VRIAKLGVDPVLCWRRVVERPWSFLPLLPRALARWPVHTTTSVGRYLIALARISGSMLRAVVGRARSGRSL